MKKLLIILSITLFSADCISQTYNLIRSINTNNTTQLPFLLKVEDTADGRSYTHTGTMTIQNGQVIFNTLECLSDICVKDESTRKILFLAENLKTVAIEDTNSRLGGKLVHIIATDPNVILLDTNLDGTVLITEWQLTE
jgi:hypothetical protein